MENTNLILWVMGSAFTLNFAFLAFMWKDMNSQIKDLRTQVLDIDRRLCRIEGILSTKESCVLREPAERKKLE